MNSEVISKNHEIYYLSKDHDITKFESATFVDSSKYNFSISFTNKSTIESKIPAYSTVLIRSLN